MDSAYIGHKIRELRRRQGLNTITLAKKVRLSQAQVSRLENGLQGFRSAMLLKFARVLGVPPVYFFVNGEDTSERAVGENLEAEALTPSKTLRKALTDPAFLKFATRCARAANVHKKNLMRMNYLQRSWAKNWDSGSISIK